MWNPPPPSLVLREILLISRPCDVLPSVGGYSVTHLRLDDNKRALRAEEQAHSSKVGPDIIVRNASQKTDFPFPFGRTEAPWYPLALMFAVVYFVYFNHEMAGLVRGWSGTGKPVLELLVLSAQVITSKKVLRSGALFRSNNKMHHDNNITTNHQSIGVRSYGARIVDGGCACF